MRISTKLLEILVCPLCKQSVVSTGQDESLVCAECRLSFPVKDGIPVMMVDEATDL